MLTSKSGNDKKPTQTFELAAEELPTPAAIFGRSRSHQTTS